MTILHPTHQSGVETPLQKRTDESASLIPNIRHHSEINRKRATQAFLLCLSYNNLFDRCLVIAHSFGDSFYCFDDHGIDITQADCDACRDKMLEYIRDDCPIVASHRPKVLLSFIIYYFSLKL